MVPLRGQECEPLAYLRLSSGEPLPKKYEGEQNKMTRNGCRRRLDTAELAEDFISKRRLSLRNLKVVQPKHIRRIEIKIIEMIGIVKGSATKYYQNSSTMSN